MEREERAQPLARHEITLLHKAATYGYVALAKLCLVFNPDANLFNASGLTPLCLASFNRHEDIVALINVNIPSPKGCGIDQETGKKGSTSLHHAVDEDRIFQTLCQ